MAISTTGPSTSQSAYITPRADDVFITSLLSAGDTVPGATNIDGSPWRFAGIPDGIGAFGNPDGSVSVLINHEIAATAGRVNAHGALGSFVDILTIDPNTLEVLSAGNLGQEEYLYDKATGSWSISASALSRLCAADLAAPSAFYDAASGLGTTTRILLNGEEAGDEGRAFAWLANGDNAGKFYELPGMGRMSFENLLASPNSGASTVVIGIDDTRPGQVYLYSGTKQASGNDIEKAGLTGGSLYGIVADFTLEVQAGQSLAGSFHLASLGNVAPRSGAELQQFSEASGVTQWLRPEDGAWDSLSANRFYFATTNAIDLPSRLWALDFYDVRHPEWGGRYTALLDGTEGQQMLDNLAVAADGTVILQEDPGNFPGAAKVWQYNPATDTLREIARHDPARFGDVGMAATAPFNQDEESSGVVEVSDLFTHQPGQRVFLLDTQAHYPFGATDSVDRQEIVQGGQLQLMYLGGTTGLVGDGSGGPVDAGAGAVPDWNAIAALVLLHFAETGTWY